MRGVRFPFKGVEYHVPAERAFALGEQIEDIVTLTEIASWGKAPKLFKLARCFAAIIRFAGGKVTNEEVHEEMMDQIKSGGAGSDLIAAQAISALIAILMNGAPEGDGEADEAPKDNAS